MASDKSKRGHPWLPMSSRGKNGRRAARVIDRAHHASSGSRRESVDAASMAGCPPVPKLRKVVPGSPKHNGDDGRRSGHRRAETNQKEVVHGSRGHPWLPTSSMEREPPIVYGVLAETLSVRFDARYDRGNPIRQCPSPRSRARQSARGRGVILAPVPTRRSTTRSCFRNPGTWELDLQCSQQSAPTVTSL